MWLLPHLYLKNRKAVLPATHSPAWFSEDPVILAGNFAKQGAEALLISDLDVSAAGKSGPVESVQKIVAAFQKPVIVAGAFRSVESIQSFFDLGIAQLVLGAPAYQQPDFLQKVCKQFPGKIAVRLEIHGKKVVIPGSISPPHKTAMDYAGRFKREGVAALFYSEVNDQGILDDACIASIHDLVRKLRHPIYCQNDPQTPKEVEKLAGIGPGYFQGIVLGKPLYEEKFDLHGVLALFNDLTIGQANEPTMEA